MNSACDWASSWASAAAYGASRLWSYGERSITYRFGTNVRPPARIALCASASRCMALRISTGWTTPLNTLAKAPSTRPSKRFSKRCRTLTAGPSIRDCAGPACDHWFLRHSLRYSCSLVLRGCIEDMMVSARRTPVRALIGWRMLLFAGASHGAYEPGANRLAPRSDHGLSWSTQRGRANARPRWFLTVRVSI